MTVQYVSHHISHVGPRSFVARSPHLLSTGLFSESDQKVGCSARILITTSGWCFHGKQAACCFIVMKDTGSSNYVMARLYKAQSLDTAFKYQKSCNC